MIFGSPICLQFRGHDDDVKIKLVFLIVHFLEFGSWNLVFNILKYLNNLLYVYICKVMKNIFFIGVSDVICKNFLYNNL